MINTKNKNSLKSVKHPNIARNKNKMEEIKREQNPEKMNVKNISNNKKMVIAEMTET